MKKIMIITGLFLFSSSFNQNNSIYDDSIEFEILEKEVSFDNVIHLKVINHSNINCFLPINFELPNCIPYNTGNYVYKNYFKIDYQNIMTGKLEYGKKLVHVTHGKKLDYSQLDNNNYYKKNGFTKIKANSFVILNIPIKDTFRYKNRDDYEYFDFEEKQYYLQLELPEKSLSENVFDKNFIKKLKRQGYEYYNKKIVSNKIIVNTRKS